MFDFGLERLWRGVGLTADKLSESRGKVRSHDKKKGTGHINL